jgi:hypothetical protein
MNEIKRLKRNTITKAAMADLKKQIRAEKTGLAAGNNFLIDHGASQGSAQMANPDPTAYLAINWQQADIEARFTSKGRRFPTPQPTTNHLLLQRPPRTTGALLPISEPNPNCLGGNCTKRVEGGRGVSSDPAAESFVSISSHGIFSTSGSNDFVL